MRRTGWPAGARKGKAREMARIPPNRRYSELQQRSRGEFEEDLIATLPHYPPLRRRFGIPPSPLSWVGGIAGAALGGMGGATLGAALGVAGAALSFVALSLVAGLGAIAFLLGILSLLLGDGKDSTDDSLLGAGGLSLLGSIAVLYGLGWLGERMNSLPLPLGDLLAVTLARWLNIPEDMGWMFQALRALIAVMGLVGLVGGGIWGAYGGFRLGYRWPGLVLPALLAMAVIAPFGLGAILPGGSDSRPAPALLAAGGGALEESVSSSSSSFSSLPTPSPTPAAVWMARVRARVRAGPGTTYPILRVLRPGEQVREQGWVWIGEEKWLHVRLSDGTTGWVRRDLLQPP